MRSQMEKGKRVESDGNKVDSNVEYDEREVE